MPLSGLFIGGGFAGMLFGSALRPRISGKALQRIFSVGMWVLGAWMLAKTLYFKI
jgi:hypothetical protein